jgi:spermidine synthase
MKMRWFAIAVGMATFSTIAAELVLTRIFSVTLYYHFAFLVISLALLGLAIAGVFVYLLPGFFRRELAPIQAGACMVLAALSLVGTLLVALHNPIELRRWDTQIGTLILIYFTSALPFVFSGFAVTISISAAGAAIGRIYAYDLVGAAIGCLFVVPAIESLHAPGAILAAAALAAASGIVYAAAAGSARRRARVGLAAAAAVTAAALLFLALTEANARRFGLARNPSKFLGRRQVLFEKWNAFSHVSVAPAGQDDHRWIFIDADAATRMWSGAIAKDGYEAPRRIPEVRVASLGYALRPAGPALIIGPGGGTDVISALRHGVRRVVGVEINPIIVDDVMRERYRDFTGGLYQDPRVEVVVDEGRSFIRRADEKYATIQATLVDTWAASSSGAFTLSENNIYTTEAFGEFMDHLLPGGILVITRWYARESPKEFLRLVAIARAALEERGVPAAEIPRHFMMAADRERRATLMVSPQPFTAQDIAAATERARQDRLPILFSPAEGASGDDRLLASFLRAGDAAGFLDDLPYDARPSRDDHPFFFYSLRPSEIFSVLDPSQRVELHNLGVLILLFLLGLSAVVTFLLVLGPLLLFRRSALAGSPGSRRILAYFASLGLGFILVEIGMMQRFVLFLGHPIYALVVVLAVLLAAAGTGSWFSGPLSERFGSARRLVVACVAVLSVVLLLYAAGLTAVFHLLLGLPLSARIAVAALLVLVPGFLMGILLPSGMRVISDEAPAIAPWAWAVNGGASVLGSVAAVFVSMNFGFTIAFLVGITTYILGAAALVAGRQASPAATAAR